MLNYHPHSQNKSLNMRYTKKARKELLSAREYNAEQKDDTNVSLKVSKKLVNLKQHKPILLNWLMLFRVSQWFRTC